MSFGITPRYVKEFALDNITPEHFLVIADESIKKLNWNLSSISENGLNAYTNLSMSSFGEEIKIRISGDTVILKSECTGSQIVDWGKNKENILNLISSFRRVRNTFTHEELNQRFEDIRPDLAAKETEEIIKVNPKAIERITELASVFIPKKGYFITPILIDLNIITFLLMAISGVSILMPDTESLIKWGANFQFVTLDGGGWRLTTNCFIHIGIIHLLMNMYALLYIGILLEPYLGRIRFIMIYLLTGFAASVSSLWWNDLTISAGASGAIFGMYGVFLSVLTTNLIEKVSRKALLTSIIVYVSFNLLNGLNGGIDNAAHIGGLTSGLLIGYLLFPSLKRNDNLRLKYALITGISAIILFASVSVYNNIRPYEIKEYDKKMQEFSSLESMALEMYRIIPIHAPRERLLHEISTRSLYYWQKNIDLIKEVDSLYIPNQLHGRNQRLLQYCELRIKNCNLIYKAIEQNTDEYQSQIAEFDKQIEKIVAELTGRN